MTRIKERFNSSKQLIPYVMGGFPDIEGTKKIIHALVKAGCEIIEIGIPYSDPLADGPTIQRASEAALEKGTGTLDVFSIIKETKAKDDYSPVLMVYYNLIYKYGVKKFANLAKESGVEGVIVPDLSVEDSRPWIEAAKEFDLDTIFLVAPTSSAERTAMIAEVSKGFIYCVSLTGVTGARKKLSSNLLSFIERIKNSTDEPVAVGFGISDASQAKEISAVSNGVIIGSAFIDLIDKAQSIEEGASDLEELAGNIIQTIR